MSTATKFGFIIVGLFASLQLIGCVAQTSTAEDEDGTNSSKLEGTPSGELPIIGAQPGAKNTNAQPDPAPWFRNTSSASAGGSGPDQPDPAPWVSSYTVGQTVLDPAKPAEAPRVAPRN